MSDKEFYEGLKALRSELLFTEIVLKNGYDPNQPRVPAGVSTGGQWTDGGSNGGTITPSKPPRVYQTEEELFAQPDSGAVDPLFDEIVEGILATNVAVRIGATVSSVGNAVFGKPKTPSRPNKGKWIKNPKKSQTKWDNQFKKRNFTNEKVDRIVTKGKAHKAPNKINPGNTATRYVDKKTGDYVVFDDQTHELIQIGTKDMKPNKL